MPPLVEGPLTVQDNEVPPPLPHPQPMIPVGGRLAHFAHFWQNITSNQWVLSIVKRGYRIPFKELPPLSSQPIFFHQSQRPELAEEVNNLLQKRAVEEIIPESPGFYSRIFLVPKKNGKLRLIIDLSTLNHYVLTQSFRMETQKKVRNSIHPKDWAFSLDLTDAYLHVLIHPMSRKYLRFTLNNKIFQFRALPFGLSTSPFVFTQLMTAIASHLHTKAISLFPYLDDWLSRNQNRRLLLQHRQFIIHLISALGLIINQDKSDLIPSQDFVFIGMEFHTLQNVVRVPKDRVPPLLQLINFFLQLKTVTARQFLSFLGKLNAAADYVELGRLHLGPLQMSLLAQWRPHKLPLSHPIKISHNICHHLTWWNNPHIYNQGVPIRIPSHSHQLFTDASLSGWGAHLEPEGILFHGVWTQDQSQLHINLLEMMAISLALKQSLLHISQSTVLVSSDNTTVISYLSHQGGTHSPNLCLEVWNLLNWCLQNRIRLTIRHIPGKFNILADRLSRINKPISTEWSLNQKNCQCNFLHDQFSQHRSFFNTSQSQTYSLCVSYPRRKSSCNRCLHDELESHSRLCLSSISSDTECFAQNPSISMQICPCSSSVAKQILVPRTTKSASVSTNISSSLSRPSGTVTRKISTSKHSTSCPSRLGIIKQSIRNKKFSREVADHVSKARRASTIQVYDSRWKIFTSWASKRKINPSKATPDIIADFLIYLIKDKNCQVSTIKGYRSMISNTLKFSSNLDIGNDPVLSELIKSFNMQRPVNRPLAPKWDLAFVLSCLCKEPYEPLSTASLIHLSMKTAFLLTMATARRVSEIHAFSIDKELLRFSSVDGSVTLRTQVGFLAKNQLPFKAPDSIFIPRLPKSHKSNNFNRLLCPVRAVKIYLKRTKSIRGNRTRLFIPTKGNLDINKSTISSWVKFTIKKAYKSIFYRHIPLFKPRAHELRALSASWAYFNFIPLDEVIKAAFGQVLQLLQSST